MVRKYFTDQTPFPSPNQQCHSTDGKSNNKQIKVTESYSNTGHYNREMKLWYKPCTMYPSTSPFHKQVGSMYQSFISQKQKWQFPIKQRNQLMECL